MLLSLVVYTSLAAVLFLLGWHASRPSTTRVRSNCDMLGAVLCFALVAGFRYDTGFDFLQYLQQYFALCDTGEFVRRTYEWGFVGISRGFAAINAHPVIYFAFWAALQIGLVYYALRNHRYLLPWIGLCIVLGPYFLHLMNTLRQGVVECLMVLMATFIAQRRFWPYLLCVVLGMLIHKAAILLLLVYPIAILPWHCGKWCWRPLLALLVCVVLGMFNGWVEYIFIAMGKLLAALGYNYYSQGIDTIYGQVMQPVVWGPTRLALLALDILLIVCYPAVRRHFSNDRLLPVCFFLAVIYMCYSNLLAGAVHFILRPGELLMLFVAVMTAYTMAYLWQSRRWIVLALVAVLSLSNIYIDVAKAALTPTEHNHTNLYHFYFVGRNHQWSLN